MAAVVVIIVGYRNAGDIAECLRALAHAKADPTFEIFISENGGTSGMDALIARLDADDVIIRLPDNPPVSAEKAERTFCYALARPDGSPGIRAHVAQMTENLGYAGGVNAWLRPLLAVPEWEAAWVLNPDTLPEPDALAELSAHAKTRRKGMVGSCIVRTDQPDLVSTRGLAWNWLACRAEAIGRGADLSIEPDPEEIEAKLVSPSGASLYITRALITSIGLMDERYFLYFEDLEWGERARRLGMVGYAHRSRVPHKCGTTIGGTARRAARSKLSVYLAARNLILYERNKHVLRVPWAILTQTFFLAIYGAVGAFGNMAAGFGGLVAGVRGEVGRPEAFFKANQYGDSIRGRLSRTDSGY